MKTIYSNLVNLFERDIYPVEMQISKGKITSIKKTDGQYEGYLLPGFIDAHIHIESSMVTPYEFSREAFKHGTIGIVSDPHEIANVLGLDGVKFMISSARKSNMKISFGAPSCVPATKFESSGASLGPNEINELFDLEEVNYLSEVMNFPGVIHKDKELWEKIEIAKKRGLVIDGHAPGLSGDDLRKYADAGISTDHECFTYEEGVEKINAGMKILIREGSAAKNYGALIPLIKEYPEAIMFCSDDLHPDDLIRGHINLLVKRAVQDGYDVFDVLNASSVNAINHYNLNVGSLKENDPADFIIVNDLENFEVISTYVEGVPVFNNGSLEMNPVSEAHINSFNARKIEKEDLMVSCKSDRINAIQAIDGELITKKLIRNVKKNNNLISIDIEHDLLKIIVLNRYKKAKPAIGFIKGFELKQGALVSSIAHDSHNIVCVGTDEELMRESINWIIDKKGGIGFHDGKKMIGLPLEIGGIMSNESVAKVADKYQQLTQLVKRNGCTFEAPYMTLAFMTLLVIPELKLSDKGLFDGNSFELIPLGVEDE